MKSKNLFLIVLFAFTLGSCEQTNTDNELLFEAEVLGVNIDCCMPAIRFTNNIEKVSQITNESATWSTYIAKNLPDELQKEGLIINLKIRKIQDSEVGICTMMGPTYPWIYIIEAKEKE